jgi:hypothetical protein
MFIKLTAKRGESVYFNVAHIVTFFATRWRGLHHDR